MYTNLYVYNSVRNCDIKSIFTYLHACLLAYLLTYTFVMRAECSLVRRTLANT